MTRCIGTMTRGVIRRPWRRCASVTTLGVCLALLVFALWSLTDGVAPASGLDDTLDDVRARPPGPTPAPGASDPPLNGQQYGAGTSKVDAQVAQAVSSGNGFRSIATGLEHTCGILTTGRIRCWGGVGVARETPPEGLFQSVDPGVHFTCAVRQNGAIACWGSNIEGQSTPPEGTFAAVRTGHDHGCGLKTDDTIVCWGRNRLGASTPPTGKVRLPGHGVLPQLCGQAEWLSSVLGRQRARSDRCAGRGFPIGDRRGVPFLRRSLYRCGRLLGWQPAWSVYGSGRGVPVRERRG